MSERRHFFLVLALAVAAGFAVATPSGAQTSSHVQVRLSGADFADPVLADYLGGLASFTDVQDDVGTVRISVPGQLHLSGITLRRTQADNALAQWRTKVTDGADYRRDVVLEFVVPGVAKPARFRLLACWPSSYSIAGSVASTIPGTTPKTVGVEVVTLVFDGYTRDQ